MNVSVIEDPVVCRQYYDSISSHSIFIKNSSEVEEKIKNCYDGSGSHSSFRIPESELCIKAQDSIVEQEDSEDKNEYMENKFTIETSENDYEYEIKTEYIDIKLEEDIERETTPKSSTTHLMLIQEEHSYSLKNRILTQKRNLFEGKGNTSRQTMLPRLQKYLHLKKLTCDICGYATLDKKKFSNHQLKHSEEAICSEKNEQPLKTHLEVQTYKCGVCIYETDCRSGLRKHLRGHRTDTEMHIYKCLYCNHGAKCKKNMKRHFATIHKNIVLDPKENLRMRRFLNVRQVRTSKMYKCDKCDYETTSKCNLEGHWVRHGAVDFRFMCDKCSYKTMYKSSFATHQLMHKDSSEIEMYTCDKCDFRTKYKWYIKVHRLKHANPSKEEMYWCDNCSFVTKYKINLKKHQLVHKDPSQMELYKCDKCSFETKHKQSVITHLLSHRNPSKEKMYECDKCGFTDRYISRLKKHRLTH